MKEAADLIGSYSRARVKQGGMPFVMAELTSKWPSSRPPPRSPLVRALIGVGVPYNFDSAAFGGLLLSSAEVDALLFGHRLHGRTLGTGVEHGMSVSADGTVVMFGDWGSGTAKAELVGEGRVCFVRTATMNCGSILRNPGGTEAAANEYFWFASPDAFPFSQQE